VEAAIRSKTACRRRPGRRRCSGWLRIARQEIPARIPWECNRCADAGVVHSPYDLRPPQPLHEQALIGIELPAEEHAELRRLELLDLTSERLVWGPTARTTAWCWSSLRTISTTWPAFVAAEANHLQDRRRQRRLDEALGKLEAALATF
jgi:hypothetical protein